MMKNKTIDQLLEIIQWANDRAKYRRACGIYSPSAYAEDEITERAAVRELNRRGYMPKGDFAYRYSY